MMTKSTFGAMFCKVHWYTIIMALWYMIWWWNIKYETSAYMNYIYFYKWIGIYTRSDSLFVRHIFVYTAVNKSCLLLLN